MKNGFLKGLFSQRTLNWIGAGLLAVCYVISLERVFHVRASEGGDGKTVVIRIAHWQLEAGMRAALDQVGAEYTKLHPNVRIEQLPVPERVYATWLVTQLIGGTAPDLIELGGTSLTDEYLARYFQPITDEVEKPNPYNAGTPLEGRKWRNTFLDGLNNLPAYNPNLLEYYGVGPAMTTLRLYYNKDLYAKAVGPDAPPPADYGQFIEACRKIEEYAKRRGTPLVPVAGSAYNGPLLMGRLYASQTQRWSMESDALLDLTGTAEQGRAKLGLGYLQGRWNLETPAFANGISLMGDVSRHMQPGFMQVQRDDATFYFLQQRAAMIVTGSWDVESFRSQASFPIGICNIPLPSQDSPRYGVGVVGPFSEAAAATAACFGLTRAAAHPEVALDFLRFLTSRAGTDHFCQVSHWLPGVEGVAVPESVQAFAPVLDGYPSGPGLSIGADTTRVSANQFYLLGGDSDSVGAYQQGLEESGYRNAMLSDVRRSYRVLSQTIQRGDVAYGALLRARSAGNLSNAERKFAELNRKQDDSDIVNYRVVRGLAAIHESPEQ